MMDGKVLAMGITIGILIIIIIVLLIWIYAQLHVVTASKRPVRHAETKRAVHLLKQALNRQYEHSHHPHNDYIVLKDLTDPSIFKSHQQFVKKIRKQIYARTASRNIELDHDRTPYTQIGMQRFTSPLHKTKSISSFNPQITSTMPGDLKQTSYVTQVVRIDAPAQTQNTLNTEI